MRNAGWTIYYVTLVLCSKLVHGFTEVIKYDYSISTTEIDKSFADCDYPCAKSNLLKLQYKKC